MTAQVVRRVRLPADHSSPGLARAAVRSAVTEAGLTEVLDEALLLTTELATNAVLHARTDMDIEIAVGKDSVTVTVMDFHNGPITHNHWAARHAPARPVDQLDERGRGLLLVDQLATYWGTLHYPDGKGVWFRLERLSAGIAARPIGPVPISPAPVGTVVDGNGAGQPLVADLVAAATATLVTERTPVEATDETSVVSAKALEGLVVGDHTGSVSGLGQRLLGGLCEAVGAAGAAIVVDAGDGVGRRTVAAFGAGAPSTGGVRVPLPMVRPAHGELVLTQPAPGYVRALVDLTAERIALTLENERLRRTDTQRRTWLTYLAEVSELLAQSLDADLTVALIPRLVVPRLGRWCAVHVTDPLGQLALAAATHVDERATPNLQELLAEALPELCEAQRIDAVVPLPAPVDGYAVSMSARGQHLGILSVGYGDHPLDSEELAVVEDVARRAALALDNARIHAERRAVAQALQRSLLPPALPKVDGIEFGAEYVPTGEGVDVGGDFYDVMALGDGAWLVVVGDVSGKGVQAATVTGLVRDVTRVLVRDGRPLPETLGRLNETLVERGGGRFCTLVLAAVTPRADGRLDVALYLAGHDRPVLLHADGHTSLVGDCGTALGLLNKISSPRARVFLAPGDTLVFYTDGVTERRRGPELYGVERLRQEAATLAGFPADVVATRLRAAALNFSAEVPRDDIAIFALRNDVV